MLLRSVETIKRSNYETRKITKWYFLYFIPVYFREEILDY